MPTDGKTQTHGFLDQLSTEQLLDLIRTDFDSGEEGDDELINRILEVIERREKEQPTGLLSGAGQAWEDFQTYYNIPDSEDCPPYPMRRPDLPAAEKKPVKRRGHGILLKRLISVAAALAVSLFSMVAAQAFGFDVFGALAQWTESTFHFVSDTRETAGSPESETIRQTIQAVFDDYGVTVPAPAWYPKGTEFDKDMETKEASGAIVITCRFTLRDQKFYIEIQQYSKNDSVPTQTFEKDASNIEEYYSNGRLFFLMSNLSESYAVFSDAKTLVTIEGNLSLDTMKQIIDSIGA